MPAGSRPALAAGPHQSAALVSAVALDAAADLVPGSPAIREVNAPTEPFARVAGDAFVIDGGPTFVGIFDFVVGGSTLASVVTFFCGNWGASATFAWVAIDIVRTDAYFHRLTAGSQTTDGIVEGPSQLYPRAILNVAARTPTSHTGETRSERSGIEVRDVMLNQLRLPPR